MFKSTKEYKDAVKLILQAILDGKTSYEAITGLGIEEPNHFDAWTYILQNGYVIGIPTLKSPSTIATLFPKDKDRYTNWNPRLTYEGLEFIENENQPS